MQKTLDEARQDIKKLAKLCKERRIWLNISLPIKKIQKEKEIKGEKEIKEIKEEKEIKGEKEKEKEIKEEEKEEEKEEKEIIIGLIKENGVSYILDLTESSSPWKIIGHGYIDTMTVGHIAGPAYEAIDGSLILYTFSESLSKWIISTRHAAYANDLIMAGNETWEQFDKKYNKATYDKTRSHALVFRSRNLHLTKSEYGDNVVIDLEKQKPYTGNTDEYLKSHWGLIYRQGLISRPIFIPGNVYRLNNKLYEWKFTDLKRPEVIPLRKYMMYLHYYLSTNTSEGLDQYITDMDEIRPIILMSYSLVINATIMLIRNRKMDDIKEMIMSKRVYIKKEIPINIIIETAEIIKKETAGLFGKYSQNLTFNIGETCMNYNKCLLFAKILQQWI